MRNGLKSPGQINCFSMLGYCGTYYLWPFKVQPYGLVMLKGVGGCRAFLLPTHSVADCEPLDRSSLRILLQANTINPIVLHIHLCWVHADETCITRPDISSECLELPFSG